MLGEIQLLLGGQPLSVVTGAADEILAVLKNDVIKSSDKKKEVEKLLNPITIADTVFNRLVLIGKLIVDYQEEAEADAGSLDGDVGVAVEFEENEVKRKLFFHVMLIWCLSGRVYAF